MGDSDEILSDRPVVVTCVESCPDGSFRGVVQVTSRRGCDRYQIRDPHATYHEAMAAAERMGEQVSQLLRGAIR